MTVFIDKVTGEYPIKFSALREQHPQTSFPSAFSGNDQYAPVTQVDPPAALPLHSVKRGPIALQGDGYAMTWVQIPYTKAQRLELANSLCEQRLAAVKASYSDSEVMSWDKQESEARAWLGNSAAVTPLIDALSSTRGVAKAELVSRIIAKADAFAAYSGLCIGNRQRLEDELSAATEEQAALIDVYAGWPA